MKKLDHIGIAVPDLAAAIAQFESLGFHYHHSESVESQKVNTAFFELGETHLELLEPTAGDSPISKFLEKRGAGIHHMCVEVDDIETALAQYRERGVKLIHEQPFIGAGGHRVAFIHPKSANGILLELVEKRTPEQGSQG